MAWFFLDEMVGPSAGHVVAYAGETGIILWHTALLDLTTFHHFLPYVLRCFASQLHLFPSKLHCSKLRKPGIKTVKRKYVYEPIDQSTNVPMSQLESI